MAVTQRSEALCCEVSCACRYATGLPVVLQLPLKEVGWLDEVGVYMVYAFERPCVHL